MSNLSITKPKVQGLWNHKIEDRDFVDELEYSYYTFLVNNYGPQNGLTLIENSVGNEFLTSSSQTLLEQLKMFHPCYKFINNLILSQSKLYGSHGLYVGVLCSRLLVKSLHLQIDVPRWIIKEVSVWIHSLLLETLYKEERISYKINIGDINEVFCVVRSIFNSKSFHSLSDKESEYITVKTVEAFLKTIPESEHEKFGHVTISEFQSHTSLDSTIVEGILYREPEFSFEELENKVQSLSDASLNIIIFVIPLSYDTEEKGVISWESDLPLETAVNSHIFKVLSKLKDKNIHIIANQKFIHQSLKYDLEKEGFFVIERLGTALTNALTEMSGCCPLSELPVVDISHEHIGSISGIRPVLFREKIYVSLLPKKSYLNVTLLLGGVNRHLLQYLKESVETSIFLLKSTVVKDPTVVAGAGCFETFIAHIVADTKKSVGSLANILGAPSSKINQVIEMYMKTFLDLSTIPTGGKSKKLIDYFTDTTFHHLWAAVDACESKSRGADASKPDFSSTFDSVQTRCACRSLCKNELPPSTQFVSLLTIKQSYFDSFSLSDGDVRASVGCEVNEKKKVGFRFNNKCVLDSWPSKMNALKLSLDGFSDLFQIGRCIYDR